MIKVKYFKSTKSVRWPLIVIATLSIIYSTTLMAEYHHVSGCGSCHNAIWGGASNLALIGDQLQTPNSGSKPVVFTATSGPNSFADGDAVYDGVCEVCHTLTMYHRNDGSDNTAHYDGEDCRSCHPHNSLQ